MRPFMTIAAVVFAVVCLAWLARLALGVPVRVDGYDVPRWFSVFPVAVTGTLAIWALVLLRRLPAE